MNLNGSFENQNTLELPSAGEKSGGGFFLLLSVDPGMYLSAAGYFHVSGACAPGADDWDFDHNCLLPELQRQKSGCPQGKTGPILFAFIFDNDHRHPNQPL